MKKTLVMKTPRSVEIAVTGKCNLRCLFCSHFTSAGDTGSDLDTGEWLSFIDELGSLSVMSVTLSGGEAFVRKDLKEIIEGIVKNSMRFNILSNATLITDEMAGFLAQTGRCDGVQVSIDGSCEAIHDSIRGAGSFAGAIQGIRLLEKHGIQVSVRVTVNKKNINDLENTASFLINDLGLSGFSTNAAAFLGLCQVNSDDIQLSIDDRGLAMKTLVDLREKYPGRVTATAGPLTDADMWSEILEAVADNDPPTQGRLSACSGPFSRLAVRSDGVMIPCIQLAHMDLGRINRDSLQKIWQEHPELAKIRERSEIRLLEFESCSQCSYIEHCTGGCPATAYQFNGHINTPSPDSCLKTFIEQGGSTSCLDGMIS